MYKKMSIIGLILLALLLFLLILSQTKKASELDEKYYCETALNCVDGSYCEKTDSGCVNYDWWQKNVGYKYDCAPDPSLCECLDNRCIKK